MSDDWRAALDDLDDEIVAVQQVAAGGFWPALAVASALIDAGLIERAKLLEIIDTLHDLVLGLADPSMFGAEQALPIERLRGAIERLELREGQVLTQLRTQVSIEALAAVLRAQGRPPRDPA